MKVMCEFTPSGPSYVRTGWGRVFAALGHEFRFWIPEAKPAFDAFAEYEPELFIGTSYGVDRAVEKCIRRRPEMKVILYASAWGPYLKDVDLTKYPIVVTGDEEKRTIERLKKETGKPDFVFIHAHDRWLEGTMSGWREIGVMPIGILNAADTFDYYPGRYRPELACDIGFVGGYWPYKARNLDKCLLPLCHPSTGLNVKLFGNSSWPVHQYLGLIENEDVRDLFASATVCPNVSEPHSTDLGWDVIERPFKILSSGGFCVSDFVEEARDLFTEDELVMCVSATHFRDTVREFIRYPEERLPFMEKGRKKVLEKHTYFDRVGQMFVGLGENEEAKRAVELKKRLI